VDQNSLIKALAFALGVVMLVAVCWGAFKAVTEAKADNQQIEMVETLDTDVALAQTIDSLEAQWNRRVSYRFGIDQDPLFLGRVLVGFSYGGKGFRELDEGNQPRLSATVDVANDRPMAIIKLTGKSHVVRVGDTFGDGYVVKDIQQKMVVLDRNGQTMRLVNTPLELPTDQDSPRSYDSMNER